MSEANSVVYIIDDDAQVRDSLANLCRSVDLAVETFSSTAEFLGRDHSSIPACLVLDIRFPGPEPSGLDFQRELTKANKALPIIFITGHGDVPMAVQAMKEGAVEFLLKPVREQALLDAIREATALDRKQRQQRILSASICCRFESLTEREQEVMALVTRGLANKQIAAELNLSEVTIKVHRGNLMRKMQASSLAELVRMSDRLHKPNSGDAPTDTKA
jgi:FixJ family two-component response regulator